MSRTMTALHPSNPYYQRRPLASIDADPPLTREEVQQRIFPPQTRRASTTSSQASALPQSTPASLPHQRQQSADYQKPRNPNNYRTRSIGGAFGGVYFEREIDTSPPNDEEIIIATVRVTDSFRRASIEGNSELPARPPKRSFIRRVSTRVGSATDQCRYTALKMPRKDYKKYFARDREGNYAGSEPEQEWTDAELQSRFGKFQEMPLRTIPAEYWGDGAAKTSGGARSEVQALPPQCGKDPLPPSEPGLVEFDAWSGWTDSTGQRRASLI